MQMSLRLMPSNPKQGMRAWIWTRSSRVCGGSYVNTVTAAAASDTPKFIGKDIHAAPKLAKTTTTTKTTTTMKTLNYWR
jgi:hypothetical protein